MHWFETFVEKADPLTLKMVYQIDLPGIDDDDVVEIQKDSILMNYRWNETLDQYEPELSNSKLNQNQIVSYYLTADELLFIHSHHSLLKEILNGEDQIKKHAVEKYLMKVKS